MSLTKGQRKSAFIRMNGRCAYCGCVLEEENYHVDHFIPKCKGGKAGLNLVASCPDCNMAKGDLTSEQFRDKLYSLYDSLQKSSREKMLEKYYHVTRMPIVFYYEIIGADKWLKGECSQRQ